MNRFRTLSSIQPSTPHSSASTTAPASTAHSSVLPPSNHASSPTATAIITKVELQRPDVRHHIIAQHA